MKAVDTNVLARIIVGDDPSQTPAAEAWVSSGVWVSGIVLVELSWILLSVYAYPKAAAAEAIEAVLTMPGVAVEDETCVRDALALWRRARGDVDFADCMIVHTASRAGHGPLGTFDRGLAQLSGVSRLGRKR